MREVALYVAVCPKCGGGWGACTGDREEVRSSLAAFLASQVLDGAEILSFTNAESDKAHERLRRECTCPGALNGAHHTDDAVCPECMRSPWDVRKRNTCYHCKQRWSAEAVLTIFRVSEHGKAKPAAAEPELAL